MSIYGHCFPNVYIDCLDTSNLISRARQAKQTLVCSAFEINSLMSPVTSRGAVVVRINSMPEMVWKPTLKIKYIITWNGIERSWFSSVRQNQILEFKICCCNSLLCMCDSGSDQTNGSIDSK